MTTLKERLEAIDSYPFHMPGHKRNEGLFKNPLFKYDFTEIAGTDDLHHPEEILKQRMDYAASVYGTKKTYFLINGSTCGLLAAVSAHTAIGDSLLMARNCHKSVYNTVYLRNLSPVYVCPPVSCQGINGGIDPNEVDDALKKTGAGAFVMVSPTYEGVVSDVAAIAEACHRNDCLLIVDEAHGAHFGFYDKFPKSAVNSGADIVIQSLHKTLPSLTQTALLHVCSDRVNQQEIEKYLSIYQSSSPSYILLSAVDKCIEYMTGKQAEAAYKSFFGCLNSLREKNKGRIMGKEIIGRGNIYDTDPSKIVIWGGKKTAAALRAAKLEPEMENLFYTLALTSIGDSPEGLERLSRAVFALKPVEARSEFMPAVSPKVRLTPYEAGLAKGEEVSVKKSTGRISQSTVYIYPPGIPIINKGEEITPDAAKLIEKYREKGFALRGITDKIRCII